MDNKQNSSLLTLPGAIIIAAAIIAIAIILVKKPVSVSRQTSNSTDNEIRQITIPQITAEDHILGNPNAPIKIVEYSDPSCAFCKIFNATMTDIMDQYGPRGSVAWVYRHYPLDMADADGRIFHPGSARESQALECAAELGGNEKFWLYEKMFYNTTPSVTSQTPNGLDPKQLTIIAKDVGLNAKSFDECVGSGRHKVKIDAQAALASKAGVSGTPTSFLVLGETINQKALDYIENALVGYRIPPDLLSVSTDKKIIVMSGAMPKALISGLIETLIQ